MKKSTTLLMLLVTFSMLTILPFSEHVRALLLFEDDFEAYSVGSFPSMGGWILVYSGIRHRIA